MTHNWIEEYQGTEDLNEKYRLLREEMSRLRGKAEGEDRFNPGEVAQTIRELAGQVEGDLIVFVANDFGLPLAFRPEHVEKTVQEEIRQQLLDGKYDRQSDLNEVREKLLAEHPKIHKAIVVERSEGSLRYHLPEGSNMDTSFLTVREMVGLIDWTTNSFQADSESHTF